MRRLIAFLKAWEARQDAILAASIEANVLAARSLGYVAADRLREARSHFGHHHHHGHHDHCGGNASIPGAGARD
jgi:hypothetical protein